jgi:outer membrane protein TolC
VEAAARDIDVAKARFYPDVNLAAFIGLQSVGLSNLLEGASRTLGAGPAITLPIFEGGRLRADLARRSADYDAAVERYKQTLVEALHDVVDHLTSLRGLEEQRSEQKRAEANAREAFDLALMRFREGVGNYLEVLTAEARLLEQRAIDIDLHTRALNLSIGLTRALGGGFDDDSAPRQHRATENEFRGDAS